MASIGQISNIPFFFIIGRPRSGTTLLRALLDAHPNVKIPAEYPVIPLLYNKFKHISVFDQELSREFIREFKKAEPAEIWKYTYLRIDEKELDQTIGSSQSKPTFTDLIKIICFHYQSIYDKKEITLLGDKNPFYATFVGRLIQIFHEAKFVYITRDYRDNFISISKFDYEAPNIILQSYRWRYVVRQFLHFSKKFPTSFLHIRYEDLVTKPEKTMESVCRFLGIPYNPEVFEFYKKVQEAYDPNTDAEKYFHQFHEGLTKPISNQHLYKWKEILSAQEIRKADATVGKYAELMGYTRKYTKAGILTHAGILPWRIYGYVLYKAMSAAEYLPFGIRNLFAATLPKLVRFYRKVFVKPTPQ